jgi:serine/threonine protein phosphatase PrpC
MSGYGLIRTSIKGDKTVNQDAIRFLEDGDLLVLCLADGVGSAPMSREGARAACKAVTDMVRKSQRASTPLSSTDILRRWKLILDKKGLDAADCQTTSSFVIVNRGARRISTGHVGDCRIAVKTDGRFFDIHEEKDFLNETDALGGRKPQAYRMSNMDYHDDFAVMIASDGIGDELEESTLPMLLDYFKDTYSRIPARERNYRLSLEVRCALGHKNGDDKSIICLWKD